MTCRYIAGTENGLKKGDDAYFLFARVGNQLNVIKVGRVQKSEDHRAIVRFRGEWTKHYIIPKGQRKCHWDVGAVIMFRPKPSKK